MRLLTHILQFKVLSFAKTTFDFRPVPMVRGIASLFVFGGFAVVTFLFAHELTQFVLEKTKTGLFLYHRFISMMLFVFFVAVNLGNIIVSYATLYRSAEVRYLLTHPIPYSNIFILKFFDNFLYSSTTLFLVALAVLGGYGAYFGYSWVMIGVLLGLVLIPFMFLSASLAVMVLMAIIKIAGRWGFRRVMAALAGLYLVGIYLFFKFTNPIKLVEEVFQYYPNVNLHFAHLDPMFSRFLPNHWVSEFLYFLAIGEFWRALPFAGLLLLVTAAAFIFVVVLGQRFFYRSWIIAQPRAKAAHESQGNRLHFLDFRRASLFSTQIESLVKREYFQFFRDPSQWIHLTVMVVLIGLFIMSVRRLRFRFDVPDLPAFIYLVLFAFGGFLVASLALRFVFPMISLEGKTMWLIRSAPLRSRRLFFFKITVAVAVVALLGTSVAFFSNLPFMRIVRHDLSLMLFGLVSTLLLVVGIVSVNLGLGSYFANYGEKNPIRVASSQGATLTFLLNLVFLLLAMISLLFPVSLYFEALWKSMTFSPQWFFLGVVLVAVFSSLFTAFGIATGLASLRRDF
ncbi:MAG: hypothetical protein FJ215_00300 [Ignavibacteria bacterium]|nr:hypothetical protein [Ignavibacteria bacterium]